MSLPFVLFINGINDHGIVRVLKVGEQNQLKYITDGSCSAFRFLDQAEFESQSIIMDTNTQLSLRLRRKPDLIFNEISDADSHSLTLKKASSILSTFQCPVLNHPDLILHTSRDQIYQLLKDIPRVIVPKTVRCRPHSPQQVFDQIAQHDFTYPVIVRECGLHNGDKMVLIQSPDEHDLLHVFPFDGREFYLIQFLDTQLNGIYTKYRVVLIDGQIRFNHYCYGKNWNVHYYTAWEYMKDNPAGRDYESSLFENFDTELGPLLDKPLKAIYEILKLDYFGVDFTLDNNQNIIIFEANSSMRMLGLAKSEIEHFQKDRHILNRLILNMIIKRSQNSNNQ